MLAQIAIIKVKPGGGETLEKTFTQLTPASRQEPGVKHYELFRSAGDPETFLVWEVYADQAALDAHMATPFVQAALPILNGIAATPIQIHVIK